MRRVIVALVRRRAVVLLGVRVDGAAFRWMTAAEAVMMATGAGGL